MATTKAISFLENKITKTGTVLDVRAWEPATFFEVDLHLPSCDMSKWTHIQHIKCRVASFTYRDYTPAWWDAETHTCTLFVNAQHEGAGSNWVKQLQKGDEFHYLGVGPTPHKPLAASHFVLLGDVSSMGHFLAMQQMAGKQTTVSGAMVVENKAHHEQFTTYTRLPMQPVSGNYGELQQWVQTHKAEWQQPVFYIAGHIPGVVQLRKYLKQSGYNTNQVKAQGFWS
jgi:NADPH-dependent ferric siderophore reductase